MSKEDRPVARRGSTLTRVPASSMDQERVSLDVVPMRFERLRDDRNAGIGEQILSSDLHDARPLSSAACENCREVKSLVRRTEPC
jgi:hypothetical protein